MQVGQAGGGACALAANWSQDLRDRPITPCFLAPSRTAPSQCDNRRRKIRARNYRQAVRARDSFRREEMPRVPCRTGNFDSCLTADSDAMFARAPCCGLLPPVKMQQGVHLENGTQQQDSIPQGDERPRGLFCRCMLVPFSHSHC